MQIPHPRKPDLFELPLICLSAFVLLAMVGSTDLLAEQGPEQSRAAVFSDRLPGFNEPLAQEISAQVQAAGYATEFIDTTVLSNQMLVTTKRYDLLVLPGARSLPMAAAPAIKRYLQEGGDLLALGLPPGNRRCSRPVANGRRARPTRRRSPPNAHNTWWKTLTALTCHAGRGMSACRMQSTVRPGCCRSGQGAACPDRPSRRLGNIRLPCPDAAFSNQPHSDLFPRQGRPAHRQLALEWTEQDGSRWIATVDLIPEWKHYVLLPERFKAWPAPAAGGRAASSVPSARSVAALASPCRTPRSKASSMNTGSTTWARRRTHSGRPAARRAANPRA